MKHKVDSLSLFEIIQDLDKHISNSNSSKQNKAILENLLSFRNNLIRIHQPDPSLNWQIQDVEVLNTIEKMQWTLIWI